MIIFANEPNLTAAEFIGCVSKSLLGPHRPLDDPSRVQAMINAADLVITARDERRRLVGLCRCITDWCWVAYCSDLAVVEECQGKGVGRSLLNEAVRVLGPNVGLALLSLPTAETFYRSYGMAPELGFWLDRTR